MLRKLHTYPTLLAGLLVLVMAMTGSLLSLEPAINRYKLPAASAPQETTSLAELAGSVAAKFDAPQRLVRRPSGEILLHHTGAGGLASTRIDPTSGVGIGSYQPSAFFLAVTELHRSFFAGQAGRIAACIGAAAMMVLCGGGLLLLVKRTGGWRHLLKRSGGTFSQRLHVEAGRFGLAALTVLAATGFWMSLVFLGVGSNADTGGVPVFAESSGGPAMAVSEMPALKGIAVADLRELVFPAAGDLYDVFTLTTADGSGAIDQATGTFIDFAPHSTADALYQLAYSLHTGQGLWAYALVLGLGGLTVPVLFFSGLSTFAARTRNSVRIKGNTPSSRAETILLVGSEGNTTWGFARSLHRALQNQGERVHTASMNDLARENPKAKRLVVLTSTYGDGDAPASASRFLSRLSRFKAASGLGYAVVGFGDRSFPAFCAYARAADAALTGKGLNPILQMTSVDRQSSQQFAAWSRAFGKATGMNLDVQHKADLPATSEWELLSRRDYGQAYQTPKAVLRFGPVAGKTRMRWLNRCRSLPKFQAGDLVGILPKGSDIPRYYSLASGSKDGFLEIAVSKQPGGLCSGQLCELQPGDRVSGFIRQNGRFHLPSGRAPVILIGAGTGVAPLVGLARSNRRGKPAFLFAGSRDPDCDRLYGEDIGRLKARGLLKDAWFSYSRIPNGAYVQDTVRANADQLRSIVQKGAHVMVCGGAGMAEGVCAAFDDLLKPLDLSVAKLRASGRYVEDVY